MKGRGNPQVRVMKLEALTPAPYNPRMISDAAARGLRASLRRFGLVQPIVWNRRTKHVVGGHQRIDALKSLGKTEAQVVLVDLPESEEKALNVTLNNPAITGAFTDDLQAILAELSAMPGLEFEELRLDLLGEPPEIEEDEVPEPPKNPVTRPGDLWTLGRHRILCGDATKVEDVGRVLGGAKPFLMVTDPPYGIELDSEWRDRAGLNTRGPAEASYMKHRTEGHTNTTISSDTRADWSEAFELVPSLQAAYVWHASVFTREVLDGLLRIGFLYPQQIIWNKGRTVLTRTHYWYQHEPCWYVRKKNAPWFGKAGENSTVWDSPSPKFIMGGSDEEKFDHPTQKPLDLMRRPILNHTKRDESVYEPFLGSGTTLIAAEQLGRRCYAIELEPAFVDIGVERWQNLTGRKATRAGR